MKYYSKTLFYLYIFWLIIASCSPQKNKFLNRQYHSLNTKYNVIFNGKEALSVGDKILSENYFQHADHFTRILNDQEKMKRTKNLENHSNNSDLHSKEENKSETLEKKV